MSSGREVVITAVGVVTPIGVGVDDFWSSLLQGRSGVGPLTLVSDALPVKMGAEIRDFDPKQYVRPRKAIKVMNREIQTAFGAAMMAADSIGLAPGSCDPDRLGVVLGSELFYSELAELEETVRQCMVDGEYHPERWGEFAMSKIQPLWMLKYLPNMPACHIGIALDARGPNNTIALSEVSGLLAMAEAARTIERDLADVMLTGSVGTRLTYTSLLWRDDSQLSHRNDDPEAACRPFDADRDGMVNGEGTAVLVLESRQHAERRGAPILARILGYSSTYERPDSATPGRAIQSGIQSVLRQANLSPAEIGHVNANGVSLVDADQVEAQAIAALLGDVPVTAPKSLFGNLGAGAGAVELAASVLSLERGLVPATLNYQTPDPNCPVNVVRDEPLPNAGRTALCLNQNRTGQAAALLIGAP